MRDYRKAGISIDEAASSTNNTMSTPTPPTPPTLSTPNSATREAEALILDAVVEKCERDGFLEAYVSQFECIRADTIAEGVTRSLQILPEVREMLKKLYANKKE